MKVRPRAQGRSRLGTTYLMKIGSPRVVHKSDVGGVLVGLGDAGAGRCARRVGERGVKAPDARLVCGEEWRGDR